MEPLTTHWADVAAAKVIREKGQKDRYVCASGITPSGVVHIGNFREEITVDFVARALRSLGKDVRVIHSWDDFDTFRKVPLNLPKQDEMKKYLRQPISRVPDAYGVAKSYAAANIAAFEKELPAMGIKPDFLYQSEKYQAGTYANEMRHALEQQDKIRKILDQYRSEPLEASWLPTAIYCEKCDRDEMDYERYPGEWAYAYKCSSCGHEAVTDIRTTKNLKLNWRTDWPMRWAFEKVDFEPGGKDHSSDGGSFATAKEIVQELWNHPPPSYVQYDFVSIKGGAGKMSSSAGNAVDLKTVHGVYSPEMVRWIFARQKPNTDFAIAFDEDVIKQYEEWDRLEEGVYAAGDAPKDPKQVLARRVYELSQPSGQIPAAKPYRPAFRILCNRLQIFGLNAERTLERYYKDEVKTPADREAFLARARRAAHWLAEYAPDEFRYQLNETRIDQSLTPELAQALANLKELVGKVDLTTIEPKDLNQAIFDAAIHSAGVDSKAFFTVVYQRLIRRDQGPRLPGFLKEIGKEKLLELL